MKINGVDLKFDATDADTLDNYLTAVEVCAKKAGSLGDPRDDQKKIVALYHNMCGYIKEAFDTIFGEGTGIAVCGENDSVKTCREAYGQLMEEYNRQQQESSKANEEFLRIMSRK